MNTMLTVCMLVCFLVVSGNALQCMSGVDGSSVRKVNYKVGQCCYKYTDANDKKIALYRQNRNVAHYGVVPAFLSKRGCAEVGKCFYTPELNKNVCVCANADDPNCQPETTSKSPK